jgi:hypothetical protein
MGRIIVAVDSQAEHDIVTRVLALLAEAFLCYPEERMEPVHRTHDLGCHLNDPVPSRHMRELVSDHHMLAFD